MTMVKKRFLKTIMITVAMSLSCVLPVFADTPATGGVGVETNTYILDENGNKTDMANKDGLYPGELIGYVIEVKNTAMPAYLRTKVEVVSNVDISITDMLKGISSDWVYTNGYYYYKKSVDQGAVVQLCSKLKVPDNNDLVNGGFSIKVRSEAVQSKNFKPDFGDDDPWHGMTVEKGKKEGIMYSVEKSFAVNKDSKFAGSVDKKKILSQAGNLMPGDTITDSLVITSNKHAKVTLKATYGIKTYPDQKDLMKLKISSGGKSIYTGSLFSDTLKNGIILGEYGVKGKDTLTFTLTMDKNLTNISSWIEIPVSFTVGGDVIDEEKGPETPNITNIYNYYYDSHDVTTTTPTPESVTPTQAVLGAMRDIPEKGVLGAIRSNIKTGDQKVAFALFLVGILAFITAVILGTRKLIRGRNYR